MRLFDRMAVAGNILSSDACSMLSAMERFRFMESGLSLIGGSGHSTESFRDSDGRGICCSSLAASEIISMLDWPVGSVIDPVMFSRDVGCPRSRPLTAVKPWDGIVVSNAQPDPEVLRCSGGDLFNSSKICLIESIR